MTKPIDTFLQACTDPGIALKNAGYLGAFLVGLPTQSYGILLGFLMLDVALGVVKAAVVRGPHSIKSYRLTAGILSKMIVLLVPVTLAWAGNGAGIDLLWLANGSLSALVLAQGYSILGNIHAIYQRKEVEEWDAVNFILKRVRDLIESRLKEDKGIKS